MRYERLLIGLIAFWFVASPINVCRGEADSGITARHNDVKLLGLIYAPENDAIVVHNGTRWNNRPLYCHERFSWVRSGEMPSLSGEMGALYVGIQRGSNCVLLQHFAQRTMRYRPGRMEWEMNDPRFAGLTVNLVGVTLADADGFTARLTVRGSRAGDLALWCMFPPGAEEGSTYKATTSPGGYHFDREPAVPLSQAQGRLSLPVAKWEMLAFADRENVARVTPLAGDVLRAAGLVASVPLSDGEPQSVAVACDENDAPSLGRLVRRNKPLDPDAIADPAKAFDLGLARAKSFSDRLIIDTPDPYLNAGAAVAVAAAAGIFVDPTFVHGGSHWRQQQPGWRTMGGAIYFGWPDQVRRAVEFWGKLQVKENGGLCRAEFSPNGCQQAGNSRLFGAGWIDYKQPPHYDFQTQFFDEAIRAWRATADPKLEKLLLPMLELHLQRCKECLDPDDDGLYESYNNTWPNDSIWFNGGGCPEQSAYVYYGHRAAADMCRRAGDAAGAARHKAVTEHIRKAVNERLWMSERGQYASYVESWGYRRQMPDAWIYAQHVPIEAGLATPEQAWKAMYYTESAMERFKLPYCGEMRQTSNFVPGMWSVRELYAGDNFAMALGYFLAGQGDEGWELLRGTMLESMYGDGVPKSGYSNDRGEFNLANHISPGGLSHPGCAIDFADIVSSFARAVVEGLFGYRPDYPNNLVKIEPSFPSAWERASIRTPDFALDFKGNTYNVRLTRPAAMQFGLPVLAARVKGVRVNGKPAAFRIEPWAGFGMLWVETPVADRAVVAIDTEGSRTAASIREVEKTDGPPSHQLLMTKLKGDVPRYELTKVHVAEREDARILSEASADAKWRPLDLNSFFNGDIRTIFKQRYASPRPETCSMRIGYDGWSAWTFTHWGIGVPEIGLDQKDRALMTPQRVSFAKIELHRNIAFTSLWDNWPRQVTVPVNAKAEAVWLLICGSTTPMQGKIANAVLRFRYADGQEEKLELVPPQNFWSLSGFGRMDYNYQRDGFSLPKLPPPQVQLGQNCRAMVYGWKLRPGVVVKDVSLETLSQDVVIGLMGVSVMNPQ